MIWRILAPIALIIGLWAALEAYGAHKYSSGHAAATTERAAQDAVAVLKRTNENAVKAAAQGAFNVKVTETKNEELAPVRERIVTKRVYVGRAICDGSPTPAKDESPEGGNNPDPPSRLVRPDVDRDIRALKLDVEEDLATGRACQATLRENGLSD